MEADNAQVLTMTIPTFFIGDIGEWLEFPGGICVKIWRDSYLAYSDFWYGPFTGALRYLISDGTGWSGYDFESTWQKMADGRYSLQKVA
jgi:hypothetical protein